MKNKFLSLRIIFVLLIFSCKKDIQSDNKITSSNLSNYSSDGLLSIQASILPPSTQSMFLANSPDGSVSYAGFDLVSGMKKIYIDEFHVAAPYPIVSVMLGRPNTAQQPALFPCNAQLFPRQSTNLCLSFINTMKRLMDFGY